MEYGICRAVFFVSSCPGVRGLVCGPCPCPQTGRAYYYILLWHLLLCCWLAAAAPGRPLLPWYIHSARVVVHAGARMYVQHRQIPPPPCLRPSFPPHNTRMAWHGIVLTSALGQPRWDPLTWARVAAAQISRYLMPLSRSSGCLRSVGCHCQLPGRQARQAVGCFLFSLPLPAHTSSCRLVLG